jgi:hypothetical protein
MLCSSCCIVKTDVTLPFSIHAVIAIKTDFSLPHPEAGFAKKGNTSEQIIAQTCFVKNSQAILDYP